MKIHLSFEAKSSTTELHIFSCFNKVQEAKASKATKKTSAKEAPKAEKSSLLVHTGAMI